MKRKKFHKHNLDKFLITACANSEWAGSNNTPLALGFDGLPPASLWQELSYIQGRKVVNLYLIHVPQNSILYTQKLTNWRNNCLKFYFMKFSGNFNQKEDNLTYHSNVIIFLLFHLQPSRLKASPVLMISFFLLWITKYKIASFQVFVQINILFSLCNCLEHHTYFWKCHLVKYKVRSLAKTFLNCSNLGCLKPDHRYNSRIKR